MQVEDDITRVVRDWLRAGEDVSADRVLQDVLALVATTPAQAVVAAGTGERQRPVASVRLLLAIAAGVVVGVVGINLLPARGILSGAGPSPSPTPSVRPTSGRDPGPAGDSILIPWAKGQVHLTLPAGWSTTEAGTAVSRGGPNRRGNPTTLGVHDVARVSTDACPGGESVIRDAPLERVGPTVEDLTTALLNIGSLKTRRPLDIIVGGFPAKRFVVTEPPGFSDRCGGPEGRVIWQDVTGSYFSVLNGGTATVYVIDVNGDRLVIATHYRGASDEEIAELDAVVASIDIERGIVWLPVGRHSPTVDGIAF